MRRARRKKQEDETVKKQGVRSKKKEDKRLENSKIKRLNPKTQKPQPKKKTNKTWLYLLSPYLLLLTSLTACSYAQIKTQPSLDVFPVETAHEDGDWTLLYRDVPLEISEDGFVIFMLPRDWMPLGLSDYDHLKLSSVISEDKAVLTFERFRP